MVIKNNIIIAGADGFIGKSLNYSLYDKTNITSIGNYDRGIGLTYFGDLLDKMVAEQIAQECPVPNILIFLVGLAHKKGKGADYDLFEKVNYQTLVNLLEALNQHNKLPDKIIFASTVSVYGERKKILVYNENTDTQPFSPYALTKLKAEKYLVKYYPERSWILRFAPVYSSDFVLNIDRRTQFGNKFYKIGNGSKTLSLCNIENIKTTIECIIDGVVPTGIYNISDPISYSYNDLLNHQGASFIYRIPVLVIRLLYILGRITNNIFLKENSTKLITDNIFPSNKIQKFIKLNSTICDLKRSND